MLKRLLQLAVAFSQECERLIEDYVDRVRDHVLYKIGKCGPLSQAYNTTTSLICHQIFTPFVSCISVLDHSSFITITITIFFLLLLSFYFCIFCVLFLLLWSFFYFFYLFCLFYLFYLRLK